MGFLGGPVDFLIHWPPGPVVATVQCQGLRDVHKRCLLEEARLVFVRDVVTKLYLALKAGKVNGLVLGDRVGSFADGIPHLK